MGNEVELQFYIRLVRKWWWLLATAGIVAGAVAFTTRISEPDIYRAQTQVVVGTFRQAADPGSGELRTGVELAAFYEELVFTQSVLRGTVEALDLTLETNQLARQINVNVVGSTPLMNITVENRDPILAADIANTVAQQLIEQSPTNLTDRQESQIEVANAQIESLIERVTALNERLAEVGTQLEDATTPSEIERLENQRNTLNDQINQAVSSIAMFSDIIAELEQRTNAIEVVDFAEVPPNPLPKNTLQTTVLAVVVGAALAFGYVLLREYLRDTIRTASDLTPIAPLPVLGVISPFKTKGEIMTKDEIIQNHEQNSRLSEEFRVLRTNLLFTSGEQEKRIYVITSPNPAEGKSMTAANLAVSLVNAGLRVLLIDADLRRPRQHRIFGVENEVGLTTLLSVKQSQNGNTETGALGEFRQCIQNVGIPGLSLITSGFLPKNPAEVIGSQLMRRWVKAFRESANIDIVIFDTPPCLSIADSAILSAAVQADPLLVVRSGSTRKGATMRSLQRFDQLGITFQGFVLNDAREEEEDYYGYNYYYRYYYGQQGDGKVSN